MHKARRQSFHVTERAIQNQRSRRANRGCFCFQHDRVLAFSEQPNQSKYPKQEGEHVARLSLLIH
jgi:hypothetical protein